MSNTNLKPKTIQPAGRITTFVGFYRLTKTKTGRKYDQTGYECHFQEMIETGVCTIQPINGMSASTISYEGVMSYLIQSAFRSFYDSMLSEERYYQGQKHLFEYVSPEPVDLVDALDKAYFDRMLEMIRAGRSLVDERKYTAIMPLFSIDPDGNEVLNRDALAYELKQKHPQVVKKKLQWLMRLDEYKQIPCPTYEAFINHPFWTEREFKDISPEKADEIKEEYVFAKSKSQRRYIFESKITLNPLSLEQSTYFSYVD